MLQRQRQLLNLLNKERRLGHRELKNKGVTQREFEIGNLCMIHVQIQGPSSKHLFCGRGPHHVIEKVGAGLYKLQKLPFLEGYGKPGVVFKESAARMEKIRPHLYYTNVPTARTSVSRP
jgi:hypothetical protein